MSAKPNIEVPSSQSSEVRIEPGSLAPKVLDEIMRRIVEIAAPEKIILFGSAARGEMGRRNRQKGGKRAG
jgi:hypothetical protein